jgi:hypothetical protein
MHFPIILIKSGDPSIYYFEKDDFGSVSKGGEVFYKSGEIYDSKGGKYIISKIGGVRKATLWKSLRYFQQMWLVEVDTIFEESIGLIDFKELINHHLSKYNKYWIKRDVIGNLQKSILQKKDYVEIMNYLK